jgi:hypothetical protein
MLLLSNALIFGMELFSSLLFVSPSTKL